MRIRSTKPEFWRSKTIATLDWSVRLVLKGLESYVDDNGVGKDDIALIAADVFPRDLSARAPETIARLSEAISELSSAGLVARYEVDGEELLYIDRWKQLQRIDKPGRGRFRRPDGTLEYVEDVDRESYRSPREGVARAPEVPAPVTGEQGNRGTGEKNSPVAKAPDSSFDDFWAVYPRKTDKGNARKAWDKALKKTTAETLIRAAGALAAAKPEPKFTAHPSTWLNGERWDDQPLTLLPGGLNPDGTRPAFAADDVRNRFK
jgi:hypothetical protein